MIVRTIERSGQLYGCFSILTMTETATGSRLRSEQSLWKTLALHAPEFVEPGVIKSQPEYLVFGHAYGYDNAGESMVGVRFAGATKWFRVFGSRLYPDAMQPSAIGKVPLDWRNSYGGADFASNPTGIGRATNDDGMIVVPHFEAPDAPWRPDGHNQVAVGFGPLDVIIEIKAVLK